LLATENDERTVFHMASEICGLEVFQGIFNCANKFNKRGVK